MKIAVTGASGFIGKPLCAALLKNGHTLKTLRYKRSAPDDIGIETVQGALDDPKALEKLVEGTDIVLHCAALVAAKSRDEFMHVNRDGTASIARAAEEAGVSKFLLLSSMAAREPQLSYYAQSKAASEAELTKLKILKWDAFRPPAVYGPGDLHFLDIFKMAKSGIGLMPAGPDARVSTIYVDDLISAIVTWVENVEPSRAAYELGGPEEGGMRWFDIFDMFSEQMSVKIRKITPPKILLKMIAACAHAIAFMNQKPPFLSFGKINELGHDDWVYHDKAFENATRWQPQTTFVLGITQTLKWYKDHGHL